MNKRDAFADTPSEAEFISILVKGFRGAITRDRRFAFVKAMQQKLLSACPKMSPPTAWKMALNNLREYLAEEEIAFGDPRFDWTKQGAIDLITAREIEYWDN